MTLYRPTGVAVHHGHMTRRRLLDGRRRHHGADQHPDRRELEREGWRTTLEYRENHVRGRDGRLRQLHVEWCAVGERSMPQRPVVVIEARGSTLDKAWSRLRFQADLADVRLIGDVRAGGSPSASPSRVATA